MSTSSESWPPPVDPETNVRAEQTTPGNLQMSVWQVSLLIGVSIVLFSFIRALSGLKSSYLLKVALHLSASQVAGLGIVMGIPAYIRPFLGAGVDLFPFLGLHRRSYYGASWLLFAIGLLTVAAIPTHGYTVPLIVALSILTGLGSNLTMVVMDSIMVSIGNRTGTIARLQAIQQGIPIILGLTCTGVIAGYVSQHWSYQSCYGLAGLLALLASATYLLVHEKPVDDRYRKGLTEPIEKQIEKKQDKSDTKEHAAALGRAIISPGLWICVIYVFYLIITPGVNTAQFYYMTNVLHFTPIDIGKLVRPGNAGSVIAIILFLFVGKKVPTAVIVWGAFLGDLSAYPMLFLLHNMTSAMVITFISAITGQIYNLCLLTFAAKACPKGLEASVYGLFISAIALAGSLGEFMGSSIYDHFGHHDIVHGWNMLLTCGIIMTAASCIMIPFLPRWARDPKFEREQLATAQ